MLKGKVVAISGGLGRIGSSFVRSVVDNNGKAIFMDIKKDQGDLLLEEIGENNGLFFNGSCLNQQDTKK